MQADDVPDDLCRLGIVKRRAAARAIPRQQQLQRDRRINSMPKEMAGQRRKRRIALTFGHTFSDEASQSIKLRPAPTPPAPVNQRGSGASEMSAGEWPLVQV